MSRNRNKVHNSSEDWSVLQHQILAFMGCLKVTGGILCISTIAMNKALPNKHLQILSILSLDSRDLIFQTGLTPDIHRLGLHHDLTGCDTNSLTYNGKCVILMSNPPSCLKTRGARGRPILNSHTTRFIRRHIFKFKFPCLWIILTLLK